MSSLAYVTDGSPQLAVIDTARDTVDRDHPRPPPRRNRVR